MANLVTLDNVEHAGLKVNHHYGEGSGSGLNQIRAFITEFHEAQREYPILFRKTEAGTYYAVCILGLDPNENLFLDGTSWSGRYVPVALRRGPFKIGMQQTAGQDATPNIQIDLEDPRVGNEDGIDLFEPNGGLSPYLNQIASTLNTIHLGMHKEEEFFKELESLRLIEPITVQIKVNDEKGYAIPDVFTVSKDRLFKLDDEEIGKMHQSGLLALCYWTMNSLSNTDNLLERKLSRGTQAVV